MSPRMNLEDTTVFQILKFAAEHKAFTGEDLTAGTGYTWDEVQYYAYRVFGSEAGSQPYLAQRDGIFALEDGSALPGTAQPKSDGTESRTLR